MMLIVWYLLFMVGGDIAAYLIGGLIEYEFGSQVSLIAFLLLWYLGVEPTTVWGQFGHGVPLVGGDYIALWVARVLTVIYFSFFLAMPWFTSHDNEKPEPARVVW